MPLSLFSKFYGARRANLPVVVKDSNGNRAMIIDPTRGSMLNALGQTQTDATGRVTVYADSKGEYTFFIDGEDTNEARNASEPIQNPNPPEVTIPTNIVQTSFTYIDLNQLHHPTPELLADTVTVYVLTERPYGSYFSDGTTLRSLSLGGGVDVEIAAHNLDAESHPYILGLLPVSPDVDLTGVNDSTVGLQTALDAAKNTDPGATQRYGKGASVGLPSGVILTGPIDVSTKTRIEANGPQGSSVLLMKHGATPEPGNFGTAMVTILQDLSETSNTGSNTSLSRTVFMGDKNNATEIEHGLIVTGGNTNDPIEYEGPVPVMDYVKFTQFSGDGTRVGKSNQFRALHSKFTSNDGYGVSMENCSDSKFIACGFGGNNSGQLKINNCPSPQFSCFDIWNPSNASFTGKYALEGYSLMNARWFQGEISGAIYFKGGNSKLDSNMRFKNCSSMFVGFQLKVSTATSFNSNNNAASYDALVQNVGATGLHFALGSFGNEEGSGIDADPPYIWKFSVVEGGDYESEAGWVYATSVDMLQYTHVGTGFPAATTVFKKHWSNDPKRVIFRTHKPGDIVCRATAAKSINEILCDGSTLNKADYPLLYLGLDNTRQLTDITTTFQVPSLIAPGPGVSWFVTAW